jgi:hypothetical protein
MAILRGLAVLALVLAAAVGAIDLVRGVRGGGWSMTSLERLWRMVDSGGPDAARSGLGPWIGGVVEGFVALPAAPVLFAIAALLFLIGRRRERHQVPILR